MSEPAELSVLVAYWFAPVGSHGLKWFTLSMRCFHFSMSDPRSLSFAGTAPCRPKASRTLRFIRSFRPSWRNGGFAPLNTPSDKSAD
jgi:hypothetical protein